MSRLVRVLALPSRSYHSIRVPAQLRLPPGFPSLLPLVLSCNNLLLRPRDPNGTYSVSTRTRNGGIIDEESATAFCLSRPGCSEARQAPIGFLRKEVSSALEKDHERQKYQTSKSPWDLQYSSSNELTSISFAPWVNQGGRYTRTSHLERLVREWKDELVFEDILRGWSDEAYPVFHHTTYETSSANSVAFAIERAALPLFGFANFGSLLIAYFHDGNKMMIWVPRRSMTKRTWPGKLDVTVGGGIGLGDTALSTIVRECAEEASLDTAYVRDNVRPVGVLPFPNRSPAGWILPGLYYLYDLRLEPDGSIVPRTNTVDGEVESFRLMDAETVLQNLVEGRFKASSALAMVDFFIRHGFITDVSDSKYADVCRTLKRDIGLPAP